jgi:oxygen-dependent protoporphyrinogen oxidase
MRVAIIGGGITGMAAAHRLHEIAAEKGHSLTVALLEAGERLGGVILTTRRDGFLLEAGPDSFITDRPGIVRLAERIGLKDRMVPTRAEYARSFVVRKGKLYPTPDGFYLVAPSRMVPFLTTPILSPLGKLRAGLDLFIPAKKSDEDESIGGFVVRRLGQEAMDRLAQPMIGAIYGGDPMKMSLLSTFPRFRDMEKKYGSIIRAMWAGVRNRATAKQFGAGASGPRYSLFMSFDFGLQVLVDRLRERLPEETMRTGCRVEAIGAGSDGGWSLTLNGKTERFDAVIVALPGPETGKLARTLDPGLADEIERIPYGPSATVSLAFGEADIRHPMDGIGFVIPKLEGLSILGCTFCHRKYPGRVPERHVLLRAFHSQVYTGVSDDDLAAKTRAELAPLLDIRGEPILTEVSRWPGGLPHYPVGHKTIVAAIRARADAHPGLLLAGNAYGGVGIPDCVTSGETAAEAAVKYLIDR